MKVVIDTNVFISAALKDVSWSGTVVRWVDKYGNFLKSIATEQELFDVLQRPYFSGKFTPQFSATIQKIFEQAEQIIIEEKIVQCRDKKDDKFLELAVNGKADIIISGDQDLLVLNPFRNIPIVDPATFALAYIARL